MTLASDDERLAMREVLDEVKRRKAGLEKKIARYRLERSEIDPEKEIDAALAVLDRLDHLVSEPGNSSFAEELFCTVDAKLYLKFEVKKRGRKNYCSAAGGFVTLGRVPPPGAMYVGPTDRPHIRWMLKAGRSLRALPEHDAPEGSGDDESVRWSSNVKCVTWERNRPAQPNLQELTQACTSDCRNRKRCGPMSGSKC